MTNGARVNASPEGLGSTPDRLVAAAEELFLEHGVDAVSLRAIGRKAGAKNVLAIQYWFNDRDGLIRALLERHREDIEVRRHTILDLYEAQGRTDIRGLAEALVRPFAAKLDQGTSGRGYLRSASELINGSNPLPDVWGADLPGGSLIRWRDLLEPLLDPDAVALHRRFHTMRFVLAELAQRARWERENDNRLFISQLIDSVAGLLTAEISVETRAIVAETRRKR